MSTFVPGIIMKRIRVEKKVTQNDVCHDICTVGTYSRIESGEQHPTMYVFSRLMERLGCDYRKFYVNVQSIEEYTLSILIENIKQLLRENKYKEANNELKKFETMYAEDINNNFQPKDDMPISKNDKIFEIRLKQQFYISSKAVIDSHLYGASDDIIDMLRKALNITNPEIKYDNICSFLLTIDEIEVLNRIATIYIRKEKTDKAISILTQLKRNMELYYTNEKEMAEIYPLLLYNLSMCLGNDKQYSQAIEICNLAISFCTKTKKMRLLPYLITNKACDLFYIGDEDSSKELLIEAYFCAKAHQDFKTAKSIKENANALFGFII